LPSGCSLPTYRPDERCASIPWLRSGTNSLFNALRAANSSHLELHSRRPETSSLANRAIHSSTSVYASWQLFLDRPIDSFGTDIISCMMRLNLVRSPHPEVVVSRYDETLFPEFRPSSKARKLSVSCHGISPRPKPSFNGRSPGK
jgi:hypothetical protein